MKKILILFTAVCFMFLMAGCGGEDKKAADPKAKNSSIAGHASPYQFCTAFYRFR